MDGQIINNYCVAAAVLLLRIFFVVETFGIAFDRKSIRYIPAKLPQKAKPTERSISPYFQEAIQFEKQDFSLH